MTSIGYQIGYWIYPDNPLDVALVALRILICPTPIVLSFTHLKWKQRFGLVAAGLGTGLFLLVVITLLDLLSKYIT